MSGDLTSPLFFTIIITYDNTLYEPQKIPTGQESIL
jgi:hypothetical protein